MIEFEKETDIDKKHLPMQKMCFSLPLLNHFLSLAPGHFLLVLCLPTGQLALYALCPYILSFGIAQQSLLG